MPALNFSPEFADDVAAGRKTQSIRPLGKRRWKVGDRVVCFTGMRHKGCRRLCEGTVSRVLIVRLSGKGVQIGGKYGMYVPFITAHKIAALDGFQDLNAMLGWFARTHGLPFTGQLIRWTVTAEVRGGEAVGVDHIASAILRGRSPIAGAP